MLSWATICPPAKRHSNDVSEALMGRDGPLVGRISMPTRLDSVDAQALLCLRYSHTAKQVSHKVAYLNAHMHRLGSGRHHTG